MSLFASEFLDFMPDTVDIYPGVLDEFGDWAPSGAVIVAPCRIEGEQRLVRDPTGQEVTSSMQVILGEYLDLTTAYHRYSLPGRYTPGTQLRAIAIDKVQDETGPCYEEIFFP